MVVEASQKQSPDWDFLIKTLIAGESILFLGPEVAHTQSGFNFWQAFVESLNIEVNPLIASYYESDELFLFPDAMAKSRIYYQMKEFYEQPNDRVPYQLIGELPYKLIVNASPDQFLGKEIGKANHSFAFFHKKNPGNEIRLGTTTKPLIYNMVGALDAEESLLMTHDDLYDFLQAMLSGKGLPERIKDSIFSARSLVFLGFRFDKWYVQLLLRLLRVQDINSRFVRYSTHQKCNADTLSICLDQFKIEFINQGAITFLEKLHEGCKQANALVRRSPLAHTDLWQMKQVIAEDKLKDGLNILERVANERGEKELSKKTLLLDGRFYRLQKRMQKGIISKDDADVELNKIRETILTLAQDHQ